MQLIYSKSFKIKPSSVNRAYGIGRNKATGKSFIRKNNKYCESFSEIELDIFLNHKKILSKIDLENEMFFISYKEFMPDFFTKKNAINKKRGDSDRYLKGAKDAVFKGLGVDDCHCVGESTMQYISNEAILVIEIYKMKIKNLEVLK